MTDTRPTNGEIVERIARLEATVEALSNAVDRRFKSQEHIDEERARAINVRFNAAEKAVETAMASAERAVLKSESASERRFEGVNEFRKSLDDSARLNIPRSEAEGLIKAANEKTDAMLKATNDKIEQTSKSAFDKTEQMSKVLAEKVDRISAEMLALNALVASSTSKRQGADEGKKEGYGLVAAMIAIGIAIASFVINSMRK